VLGRPNREPSLCISVTPVRYVPVAKVNPQLGMSSSGPRVSGKISTPYWGSILPEKLALSALAAFLKATGTKQTAIEIRKKKRRVHGVRT